MADIFLRPNQYLETGRGGNNAEAEGNEIQAYISSLPENERQEALKRITAPINGKDIADKMMEDEKYIPTLDEFKLYKGWKNEQEVDILDALSKGSEHILDTFGKAIGSATDHPLSAFMKSAPSLLEAFTQGSRNLYGMVAQSQDPTSPLFKLKNALQGGSGNENEEYRVFKEARRFNESSMKLMRGEDTIIVNKDYIDNDMTQAMSYIADPTLFIPFGNVALGGAKLLGMGERVAMIGSRVNQIKHMVLGGALRYGVGMPIEFLGNATRNTIDYGIGMGVRGLETATGIPAAELRATARASMVGTTAASLAGYGVPYVSGVGEAYVAGTAGRGLGEALAATGEQIMKGERGINSYAKAALEANKDILSPHAKGLLNVLNAVDPLFVYTADAVAGATHGAFIGGGLGYLSGGKEGMAHGLGAGIVLGAGGAMLGRTASFLGGRTYSERTAIQAKMALEGLKDLNPSEHQARALFQKLGVLAGHADLTNGTLAGVDNLSPNVSFKMHGGLDYAKFLLDNGFDPVTGKHMTDPNKPAQTSTFEYWNSDGMVVEKGADGKLNLHINIDKLSQFGNTVPHEVYHAIFRDSKMAPEFVRRLKDNLIGVRDQNGKLLQEGSVSLQQTRQMFRKYIGLTARNDKEKQDRLTQLDDALNEHKQTGQINSLDNVNLIEKLTEEFGAYYFAEWIKGKSPDYLFLGGEYTGLRSVLEVTKGGWIDFWASAFGRSNPTEFNFSRIVTGKDGKQRISYLTEDFAGDRGGRVRNKALDLAMEDMVKAVRNSNRTNTLDLASLSPEGRREFIDRNGLDGHRELAGASRAERRKLAAQRKQMGQDLHKALSALDPAQRTSVVDPTTGNITGRLSKPELDHLVVAGLMSRAMADKIGILQDVADRAGPRAILEYGYVGDSHHTSETSDARVYGDQVPYTNRRVLLMDFGINIGAKGELSFLAKTLDWAVIEERGNRMWKQDAVRALWGNDRQAFDRDFIDYLSNASKDKADATRKQSADLLDHGDGNGAARRNVLHQVSGFVKDDNVGYINKPLGEIHKGLIASLTNFSALNMTSIRVTGEAYDFNFKNAFEDISRNFKPSEMKQEVTPEGVIYKHASGYKFIKGAKGASAYDEKGFSIGAFKTVEEAAAAGKKLYEAREKATDATSKEITDKHGNGVTFKPREEHINEQIQNNRTKIIELIRALYEKEHNSRRPENERIGDDLTAVSRTEDNINASAEKAARLRQVNDDLNKFDSGGELTPDGRDVGDLVRDVLSNLADTETSIRSANRAGYPSLSQGSIDALRAKPEAKLREVEGYVDKRTGKTYGELFKDWKEYLDIIHDHPSKWALMEKALTTKQFIEKINSGKIASHEILAFADKSKVVADSNVVKLKQLINSFGDNWDAMYPMTFRSALTDKVEAFVKNKPNMTYQQLLKNILVNNDGHKLWSEADAIGLLDFIKSKITPTYTVRRAMDGTNRLIQMRQGETQAKVDVNELREFIKTNQIDITIDEGAKEVHGMNTSLLTSSGTKENYTETAVRINLQYAHGIRGHYGKDTIVHVRTTTRYDSEGNKYLFVEEVQANNTASDALTKEDLKLAQESLALQKPIIERALREGVWARDSKGFLVRKAELVSEKADVLLHHHRAWWNEDPKSLEFLNKAFREGDFRSLSKEQFRDIYRRSLLGNFNEFGNLLLALGNDIRVLTSEIADYKTQQSINGSLRRVKKKWDADRDSEVHGYDMSELEYQEKIKTRDELIKRLEDFDTLLYESFDTLATNEQKFYSTLGEDVINFKFGALKSKEISGLYKEYYDALIKQHNLQSEYRAKFDALTPKERVGGYGNPLMDVINLVTSPHRMQERVTDLETKIQQALSKKQQHPLTEISEWSKVALLTTIREAIRKGIDNVSLTHPDDSPVVSNMKLEARHADYGVIFPQVWQKFLAQYGIEIKRQGKITNPDLSIAKQKYTKIADKVTSVQEKALKVFQLVGTMEDPVVVNPLAELLSKPMEVVTEADFNKAVDLIRQIRNTDLNQVLAEVNNARKMQHLEYKKMVEAEAKEYRETPQLQNVIKDADKLSAALIDRGYSFTLNKKIKEAFMRGDEGSPMTAYKPTEEETGNLYPVSKDYVKSVNIKPSVAYKPSEDYNTFSKRVLDDLSTGERKNFQTKEAVEIWGGFLRDYVEGKGGDYGALMDYINLRSNTERLAKEYNDAYEWYQKNENNPDAEDDYDRPRSLEDIKDELQTSKDDESDAFRGLSNENDQVLPFVEQANQFFDKLWKGNYKSWSEVRKYAGFEEVADAVEQSISRQYNKKLPPVFKSELFNVTKNGDRRTYGGAIMTILEKLGMAKKNPDMISGWDWATPNGDNAGKAVNAKTIINMLERMAGSGNKAFTEAKQIGLIEYLVNRQMGIPHDKAMKYITTQPEIWAHHGRNPTERQKQLREQFNKKGQGTVTTRDLIDFVESNEFKLTIDENPIANVDSESYVAGGSKEGYRDIVIRMPVDFSHGVEGHFGHGETNVVAHVRVTFRRNADGKKVMHIEEVQANNANEGLLTEKQKEQARVKIQRLNDYEAEYQKIVDKYNQLESNTNFKIDDDGDPVSDAQAKKALTKLHDKRDAELKVLNDSIQDLSTDGSRMGRSYAKRIKSELATAVQKTGNNAPAQDFGDWTKMAFKALMREAVINGVDRVTLTPYHKTPVQVGMTPESAKSLYGTGLPNSWSSLLKKINAELKSESKFTADKSAEIVKQESIKLAEDTSKQMHTLNQHWSTRVGSNNDTDIGYIFGEFHKDAQKIIDEVAPQNVVGTRMIGDILRWQTDMENRIYSIKHQRNRDLAANVFKAKKDEIQHLWNSETDPLKELKYKGRRVSESSKLLDESLGFDMTPEAIEFGSESQPNFKPSEVEQVGDGEPRGYSKTSLRWKKGFIGRYAEQNPEITKEIKLSFQSEPYSKKGSELSRALNPYSDFTRFFGGRVTQQHYLAITEAGKEVGYITWKTLIKDGKKYFADPSVRVHEEFRGKKYQHLLYSEAAERARAMGAKQFLQRIENEEGLPLKSQLRTFGEESTKLLSPMGKWMEPTMENFYDLKNPKYEIHHSDESGNVTKVETSRGKEAFVYSWSSMHKPRYKPTENWSNEKTPTGNVFKTISGYVITQMGNKFKVYSTDKALLGIYNDLDQAKRRVDRENSKQ
jgi:hypothetical protein